MDNFNLRANLGLKNFFVLFIYIYKYNNNSNRECDYVDKCYKVFACIVINMWVTCV